MDFIQYILIITGIILFIYMIKKLKVLRTLIYCLTGFLCLVGTDVIMSFYGGNLPLNPVIIAVSSLGGIPGVIGIILINTFLI